MKSRVVLVGPPAAGKGTQAELILARYGIPIASPGAILRNERSMQTKLGLEADILTSQGKLVGDSIIVDVVRNWLDDHFDGFVFDGFPRTVFQAKVIDDVLQQRGEVIDVAITLDVDDSNLERRIVNRLVCVRCSHTVSLGTKVADIDTPCPKCAGKLHKRGDDTLETFGHRMREYREKTVPVIDYYQGRSILRRLPSSGSPEQVFDSISKILEAE